ncbi:MAG: DnaJ domain-containing protein, partial [Proteobacteria bacterium]|nr:DnaJ domain-containing protein [Pseudomonadota bacterium]
MDAKDYYKILKIEQNADPKQIKEAYRELAFKYHPDRNKEDPESGEKMKMVNEAYAVLSDPQKRQQYDALRRQYGSSAYSRFRKSYSEQDIYSGSDIHHIFEEMAKSFGFRGVDEIFKEFYGPEYRTFEFKKPGFTGRGFVFWGRFGPGGHHRIQSHFGGTLGKLTRYLFK